jgi:hypothetical protein
MQFHLINSSTLQDDLCAVFIVGARLCDNYFAIDLIATLTQNVVGSRRAGHQDDFKV